MHPRLKSLTNATRRPWRGNRVRIPTHAFTITSVHVSLLGCILFAEGVITKLHTKESLDGHLVNCLSVVAGSPLCLRVLLDGYRAASTLGVRLASDVPTADLTCVSFSNVWHVRFRDSRIFPVYPVVLMLSPCAKLHGGAEIEGQKSESSAGITDDR
ncbi:hypothetical protein ARMGADRAFT_1092376 [Armillaria gallica]|uniref:Uncharacterized protein n=1 Tax=Armillaria gallica TaxID=47427 RepID=A0A2H3CB56_ARMGA|nr:hypothetical protein ARMGADRAFT_1092376 [Armillaria gallica]